MTDKTPQKTNQSKKKLYSRINFISCIVAFAMVVALPILNIVARIGSVDMKIHLALAITFGGIGLLAIIPMAISWQKLRKLNQQPSEDETKDI